MASTKKDAVAVVEHIEQLSLTDSHSDSDSEPELFRAYSDEQAEGNGRQRPPRYAALDDFDFLKTGSGTGNARGELKIVTDGGPGCGGHLWPSAVVLTRYIQHRIALNPSQWQNKTCVELGAGTGVVAIALAHLDVPGLEIYSTDLEELLPLARQNVELNGMQDKVKVEELYWGRPIPDTIPSQPDIILMADCIYLEITFPWLIDTLLRLSNEKTEILLCYKKRRNADKHFFSLLRKQFTFSHVQDDPMKPTYDREGLFLYSVKRKPTAIASVKRLRRKPTEPQL